MMKFAYLFSKISIQHTVLFVVDMFVCRAALSLVRCHSLLFVQSKPEESLGLNLYIQNSL